MEDPQDDSLVMHSFCVCSDSALLVDLLGVSRSVVGDFLSLRLILGFSRDCVLHYHFIRDI